MNTPTKGVRDDKPSSKPVDKLKDMQTETEAGRSKSETSQKVVESSSKERLSPSSSSSINMVPIQPAKKTPEDYIFGKVIGDGSFSSVYLAKDAKTGKEYAIKVCDKHHIIKERKTEQIKREKEAMTILSGNRSQTAPYFVHLYATFQDAQRLYFVMTLAHGGELLKYLNKLGSFERKISQFYAAEILQGLQHLHKLKIVHRDVKPENILLNETGHILITDFGSAKVLQSLPLIIPATSKEKESGETEPSPISRTKNNSFVGTAQYVSPEVLQGRYNEVGPAADLWAYGCVIYQFITGSPPFQAPSEFLMFRKIVGLEYEFPESFDEEAKDLVSNLLKLQISERLGALDSKYYSSIQAHAYFAGIEFDKLHEQQAPSVSSETLDGKVVKPEIPATYAPGFNPRVIAERFLREDDDLQWDDKNTSSPNVDTEEIMPTTSASKVETDNLTDSLKDLGLDYSAVESNVNVSPDSKLTRKMSSLKFPFPINDSERVVKVEEQAAKNPWHKSAQGNLILKQGIISKRKGLFSRKRMLLLTEGPHLYYCDPSSMAVKGEIPWSSTLKPEAKDFKVFYIHTPNRIYYMEDSEGFALAWCDAISGVQQAMYEEKSDL